MQLVFVSGLIINLLFTYIWARSYILYLEEEGSLVGTFALPLSFWSIVRIHLWILLITSIFSNAIASIIFVILFKIYG